MNKKIYHLYWFLYCTSLLPYSHLCELYGRKGNKIVFEIRTVERVEVAEIFIKGFF